MFHHHHQAGGRDTPPKTKMERTPSNGSVGPEYSESSPELENALTNKNWTLVRKCLAQGYGTARKNLLHKAIRVHAPVEILEMMVEKGCDVDETQEVRVQKSIRYFYNYVKQDSQHFGHKRVTGQRCILLRNMMRRLQLLIS